MNINSMLPEGWRQELRRYRYAYQIHRRHFLSPEPELSRLGEWLQEGDWVLDIGANVGHYALALSNRVGPTGRVICFEPIASTFALLAANAANFPHANTSLFNAAASDHFAVASMTIPTSKKGVPNYYQAAITPGSTGPSTLTIPVDALGIAQRIALIKIDTEGHEAKTLNGLADLIRRDRPRLIVENSAGTAEPTLFAMGYETERLPRSPNVVYHPSACRTAEFP